MNDMDDTFPADDATKKDRDPRLRVVRARRARVRRWPPAVTSGTAGPLVGVRVAPSAPRTPRRPGVRRPPEGGDDAPPEDNRANGELVEALARWLGLRRDTVRIESGHASRDKVVAFAGMDEAELRRRLTVLLAGRSAVEER